MPRRVMYGRDRSSETSVAQAFQANYQWRGRRWRSARTGGPGGVQPEAAVIEVIITADSSEWLADLARSPVENRLAHVGIAAIRSIYRCAPGVPAPAGRTRFAGTTMPSVRPSCDGCWARTSQPALRAKTAGALESVPNTTWLPAARSTASSQPDGAISPPGAIRASRNPASPGPSTTINVRRFSTDHSADASSGGMSTARTINGAPSRSSRRIASGGRKVGIRGVCPGCVRRPGLPALKPARGKAGTSLRPPPHTKGEPAWPTWSRSYP